MYVLTVATLLAQAAIDLATGGPIHLPNIALFFNNLYPSRTNVLADYTITDVGGFTNIQAVTFGTPFLNGNQQAEALGGLITWLTTALTDLPATAYGIVLLNTDSSAVILAERFATPVSFNAIGNSFSLIPRLVYDT